MRGELIGLTFLITFAISLGLLLGGRAVRRGWIAAGDPASAPKSMRKPPRPDAAARVRRSGKRGVRVLIDGAGDWPRTTRVLPWMIAGFLILLWLVPFNTIQLTASLPFDLKLDRILLPFLFGTWLLALATGGDGAPKVRVGVIHVGIGLFVAAASLSILTNVPQLNQALEFDPAIKQLVLLLSFALFFLIVASSIRPTEVPAFMSYSLVLAVLCALGSVWEYRFHYNVFYDLSHRLLPHIFEVQTVDANAVDELGRSLTRGPTEHPLELVGVMCMALPIAIVGILNSPSRNRRIMYSLAAVVLMAAAVATDRKSAFLAPIANLPHDCLLPPSRSAQACAARPAVAARRAPSRTRRAGFDLRPGQAEPPQRGNDQRPHVGLRRDPSGCLDAPAVRARLRQLRPCQLSDPRFGGAESARRYRRRWAVASVRDDRVDLRRGAEGDHLARPQTVRRSAWRSRRRRSRYGVLTFLFDMTSFPHTPYLLMSLAGFLAALGPETQRRLRPPGDAARLSARHAGRTHRRPTHLEQSLPRGPR